jgi:hypothetical protein
MTYYKYKQVINLLKFSCIFAFFLLYSVASAMVIETIDFETGDYSQCRSTDCHKLPKGCMGGVQDSCTGPGKPMKIDSGAARSGNYSSKHTLYNCAIRSEAKGKTTEIGETYWYGWSYYFPEDFNQNGYTIVNQMDAWPPVNPMPAGGCGHKLDVQNEGWYYTLQRSDGVDSSEYSYHYLGSLTKGVWTDFVMHVKWTGNTNGFLKLWKNNSLWINYNGRTWWNNEDNGPFFCGGEYKGQNYWADATGDPDPVIIYLDEVRVGNSSSNYAEVYPPTPYNLELEEDTVEINTLRTHKATNSITVDPEGGSFLIEGDGSNGGSVSFNTKGDIILKPGFEAQLGSSFLAIIDEGIGEGEMSANRKSKNKSFEYKKDTKEKKESIPKVFSCSQNYPNPFAKSTIIEYGLPKDSEVQLDIYNLLGQKIQTLVNAKQSAGYKKVSWDGKTSKGTEAPQGIYFYTFKAGDFEKKRKMILLK